MIIATQLGLISLGYTNTELLCAFGHHAVEREPTKKLANQLRDYFAGIKIASFSAPIPDGSSFTKRCWKACRRIPYGKTISYKELATIAGSPNASRAAGQAMRNNPLLIITPCHRVVSSNGALHGYAGSTNSNGIELKWKQFLLNLETGIMSP